MISAAGFYDPLWFVGRQKQKLESARHGFPSLWLLISGVSTHLWPTHLISQCFHTISVTGPLCIGVLNITGPQPVGEGTKAAGWLFFCFVSSYGDSHLHNKPKSCVVPSDARIRMMMLVIWKPGQTIKRLRSVPTFSHVPFMGFFFIITEFFWECFKVFPQNHSYWHLWTHSSLEFEGGQGCGIPVTSHGTQDAMSPSLVLNRVWGLIAEHKEHRVVRKENWRHASL